MIGRILYLLGIVATIAVGSWLYTRDPDSGGIGSNSPIKHKSAQAEVNKSMKAATFHTFSFSEEGLSYSSRKNFKFMESGFEYIAPVDDSIKAGIAQLKQHLKNNSTQGLIITGFSAVKEENTSAFPSLGYARANNVKNYMESKGIPATQIKIEGENVEELMIDEGIVSGAVSYALFERKPEDKKAQEAEMETLKKSINEDPLVLHFNTGQTHINLSAEQRQKIADIARYMDNVRGAHITVVGHTDNTGSHGINMKIGRERADFLKSYLISQGVSDDRITSTSRGPNAPVADNSSEAGRAQNRRTVVKIK